MAGSVSLAFGNRDLELGQDAVALASLLHGQLQQTVRTVLGCERVLDPGALAEVVEYEAAFRIPFRDVASDGG